MAEIFLEALATVLSGQNLLYLLLGVALGLVVGVLPGFGGAVGLALLLPFVYGMDPISGVAMLIGVTSVVCTSDTFPAVLIGIPGSVSSQATVVDGFPLAKKGQAARALSAAFTASMFGGVFGAVVLTGAILVARPIVLAFGTGEMLMLAVLGISMVGVLTGQSVLKGLLAAALGLMIGMIGVAPATSEYRFEFEILYLSNGVPLLIIALAVFALPEIVDLLRSSKAVSDRNLLGHGWLQGMKDAVQHKWLILRCAGIGCLIGILPGLGGSVVDWIAYAHAMQSAKDRSEFGKGDIRGVLAPESSNNAKEGGALIPTLIFGIPGSSGTAILMGGMILLGVEPGITMVTHNLPVVYTIIWSLAIANVIGAIACIALAGPIARLSSINFDYIAPFMIMLIMFAAFQSSKAWGDLFALTLLGIMAIYMRRYGYSRPALVVGFVLAQGIETNLYQTVNFYGLEVFMRPIFLVLLAMAAISTWIGLKMVRMQKREANLLNMPLGVGQLIFLGLVVIFSAGIVLLAQDLMFLGRIFPTVVGSIALVTAAALFFQMLRKTEGPNPARYDEELAGGEEVEKSSPESQILWFIALMAIGALVGFFLSIGIFIAGFLKLRTRLPLHTIAIMSACGLGVLALMGHLLHLDYPRGLLQYWFDLPWPLS
ncbi:tripartite tricarboxylate transporter permease [Pelagibius sp. 7325]|uniref:tripartite tricarboxylate transporter permease n=1 Tax=Pelagibius sp. 7325 TaxID=3131994 RepID=UPI0030EB3E97